MTYPPTKWGTVEMVRSGTPEQRDAALAEIITLYGPPLVAFARHESRGALSREDCEDVVHDFFLRCVEGRVLEEADPARGRFRNFLARSFKNSMLNAIRYQRASMRTPAAGLFSLHELIEQYGDILESRADASGDDALDRVFRLSLFTNTLMQFGKNCSAVGHSRKFQMFVRREIAPARADVPPPSYAALAAEFGLPSDAAVGHVIRAARNEFVELLLTRIREDFGASGESEDIEQELQLVLAAGLRGHHG
jgi:RNA polymerase sigma factor (sigma-70 family)